MTTATKNTITKIADHGLKALEAINDTPGAVFELSTLTRKFGKDILAKGYFDDREALAAEAAKQTLKPPINAIYVNLQEIDPACLHRAKNKMQDGVQAVTAADVTRYRNFLIDVDRKGIKGISATEAEKAEIREALLAIKEFLIHELGWPDEKFDGDSGNGGHIDWAIDLPPTKENQELLKHCYLALNQHFGSKTLSIDASLADPNQLIKFYGTKARKGDDTAERPHRWSQLLNVYETEPVTLEQLQALAALYEPPAKDKTAGHRVIYWRAATPENVEAWAERNELELGEQQEEPDPKGGTCYKWDVDCLTSTEHKDGAVILLNGAGYLNYKCHHNSCSEKKIADILAKYPPSQPKAPEVHVNGHSNKTATQPTSPRPTADEVLQAIHTIAADEKLQPKERQVKIGRELGQTIGDLDRAAHAEVITALVDAQADFTKTDAKDFVRGCVADAKDRQKERQKEQRRQRRQNQAETKTSGGRATIQVNDRQLDAVIYDALSTIREQIKSKPRFPCMYIRGGILARVAADEDGICAPEVLSEAAAGAVLSQLASWVGVTAGEDGAIVKDVYPPTTVSRTLLSWGAWPGVPALDGVVSVPVFGKDGRLHDSDGYDPATRLFYPGGVKLGDTTPTDANVERSKALICDELLGEFPFKKDGKKDGVSASKTHAVAMVLLPFVRTMIDGPTPLHLVDSPTPGTGKGLLTVATAYPALGYVVASTPAGKDDEEWRKRITSFLRNGSNFVLIDNVTMPLDSGVLASALTQPVWEDRILGLSQTVRVKVRCVWAATGNNVLTSKEIARRTVWIRLDANDEKPWDRNFKHENLIQWCKVNRDQLVTAAITLIRNWVAKGSNPYAGRAKGSYPEWTAVIGGILHANGIAGFLENEDDLHKLVNSESETLKDFILAWAERHGKDKVGVKALFELASYPDEPSPGKWKGLLDGQLGAGKQRARQTQLGLLLSRHRDTVIAGHKIVFAGNSNGQKHYNLVPVVVERVERVEPFLPNSRGGNENFSSDVQETHEKISSLHTGMGKKGSTRSTRSTLDSHSDNDGPPWADYEPTWAGEA